MRAYRAEGGGFNSPVRRRGLLRLPEMFPHVPMGKGLLVGRRTNCSPLHEGPQGRRNCTLVFKDLPQLEG